MNCSHRSETATLQRAIVSDNRDCILKEGRLEGETAVMAAASEIATQRRSPRRSVGRHGGLRSCNLQEGNLDSSRLEGRPGIGCRKHCSQPCTSPPLRKLDNSHNVTSPWRHRSNTSPSILPSGDSFSKLSLSWPDVATGVEEGQRGGGAAGTPLESGLEGRE